MLTSSTQLQIRSFHVVERTRTPTKLISESWLLKLPINEGLTLETQALWSSPGDNLTIITLFDEVNFFFFKTGLTKS